ncbi:MAG TPA: tetratricopeptide repeat protein [Candidatus Dormibacteraeota bacterium]|nr:tetratricopeptide repeat protein [Candidatus Dormibacteraeota bacterium]
MLILVMGLLAGAMTGPGQSVAKPAPHSPSPAAQSAPAPTTPSAPQIAQPQALASGGDASAELKLAKAYESGNGVEENDQTAAEWCKKAANQGNADAQALMGLMYLTGQGVARDKKQAVWWFHKAAFQGNSDAMFNLGASYYNGDGVGPDEEFAYAWFLLAKAAGSAPAAAAVQREDLALDKLSMNESFDDIATMYDAGASLPKNEQEASEWYLKAASRGDASAQIAIAARFLNGVGVARDFDQGRHWCEEAAKNVDNRGMYCMGLIYQRGLGVPPNMKEARKWYQRASDLRNHEATLALAEMDVAGEGTKTDRVAAALLYAGLIRRGDAPALKSLVSLKKQMSSKEWKKFERQLPAMFIDPKKLNKLLSERAENAGDQRAP